MIIFPEYEQYEKSYRDLENTYDSIILNLEDNGAEYIWKNLIVQV